MPSFEDLEAAVADLDDVYLHIQLLLAQHRAGSEEPRRAGFWNALAMMLTEEQGRRGGPAPDASSAEAVQEARESLIREANLFSAEYAEASGQMATAEDPPAG